MSHTNPNAIQTTGVYDENVVQPNTVDRVVGDATLSEFKNLVSTAYQNNAGGVIDGSVLGGYYAFGAGHTKVMRFLPANGTNWGIGSPGGNPTPISGTGAFASTSEGGYNYTSFSFGPIDGGAANEQVVAFGVTALSITNRNYGFVTVKAFTNTSHTISRSSIINDLSGRGDTLYNFTQDSLAEGEYYTGFEIRYSGAITIPDFRLWFDDIAFVTNAVTPPSNTRPVGEDDVFNVSEDVSFNSGSASVLDNDTDADGDPLTASLVLGPDNGVLDFRSDGTFTYTPNANFNGTDTFVYVASDGDLNTGRTFVTLNVASVNDDPILNDASFVIDENSPAGSSVGTVQGTDVDGDALSYAIVGGNQAGAFAIDPASGQIVVANSAPLDFETTPQFNLTVRASDPSGGFDDATVTVTLNDLTEIIPIAIDILPGDVSNSLDPSKNKPISVALYGSALFDVSQVDIHSLTFGQSGDEQSLRTNRRGKTRHSLSDLNGDGYLDLIVQFDGTLTNLQSGDTQAILRGQLTGGMAFEGSDSVSIVKKGKGPG